MARDRRDRRANHCGSKFLEQCGSTRFGLKFTGVELLMKRVLRFICVLLLPLAGTAHVNSPDVYFDGYAGPYHLLVTMRPPAVVPGLALVQIRSISNDVNEIKILPLRMIGVGAKMGPLPDPAERSKDD